MLSFATDFPVAYGSSAADFLKIVREWIGGSPHCDLNVEDLSVFDKLGRSSVSRGRAFLDVLHFQAAEADSAAIRYVVEDGAVQWMTLAAFSRNRVDAWVSVRTSCESLHASVRLPPGKKPLLVKQLLDGLAKGDDSGLVVGEPIYLSSGDMGLATDLILGRARNRMPIVYVSSHISGRYAVNVNQLKWRLSGVAHLVVEPDRAFSFRLRRETDSENVYGGAVGIYWPDGGGRPSQFRRVDYISKKEMEAAIESELRLALINRRPLDRCTFSSVDSSISRVEIEQLKKAGDKGFDEYAAHFDVEIQARNEALESAEREIARLKAETRERGFERSAASGISFSSGDEQNFYGGEILDAVLLTLKDSLDRIPEGTRRKHLITAVLTSNAIQGGASRKRDKLKDALRGYRSLDKRTRQALEELGFSIDQMGKHPRAVFQDDERYAYDLPSSGSDHRGGLNAALDIAKLVF